VESEVHENSDFFSVAPWNGETAGAETEDQFLTAYWKLLCNNFVIVMYGEEGEGEEGGGRGGGRERRERKGRRERRERRERRKRRKRQSFFSNLRRKHGSESDVDTFLLCVFRSNLPSSRAGYGKKNPTPFLEEVMKSSKHLILDAQFHELERVHRMLEGSKGRGRRKEGNHIQLGRRKGKG
jgi:hypothetical protein